MLSGSNPQAPHLLYIVTDAVAAARSFAGQMKYMREQGYRVTVIGSPGPSLERVIQQEQVDVIPLAMEREIHPTKDLQSLWQLFSIMRKLKPDLVHTATPKASLLGMICAYLLRIPVRYYGLWGLRMETTTGFKRQCLWWSEWLTSYCSHIVLSVGAGLKHRYAKEGLAPDYKIKVVGQGSANGVDLHRFSRTKTRLTEAVQLKSKFEIPLDKSVLGYVGRLTKDKGIRELKAAFESLLLQYDDLHLLLVGDFEKGDPVELEIQAWLKQSPAVSITGFVDNTAPFYGMIDMFVFPSYREGLPNVLLEASAARLPIVASNCTGNEDIVHHGRTGLVVNVGDDRDLEIAIRTYLDDPLQAESMASNAHQAVVNYYDHQVFWSMLEADYQASLKKSCPQFQWPLIPMVPAEERRAA
jgi:glycosyltransferase involved in cell wall biosynthesis